jgi:hypothetical protein
MTGPTATPADPTEHAYRSMAGALDRGDAPAALGAVRALGNMNAIDDAPKLAGDAVLLAIAHGLPDAAADAAPVMAALAARDADGDEVLLDAIRAALGEAPVPLLRPLPVDLDDLATALEGDPGMTGGSSRRAT